MKAKSLLVAVLSSLAAVIFTVSPVGAQDLLPRSTYFGLAPESAAAGEGIVAQTVMPGATAAALGMEVGDQLKSINGTPVPDFPAFAQLLGTINEGAPLTVEIVRGGKDMTLTGLAKGRLKESGEGYSVDYGQFSWGENRIRTITYTPDNPRADRASVMYIQGFTCGSIDYGMIPNVTLKQLLDVYAEAGFTVFKMEKPGVGDSQGPLRCDGYDFNVENEAFQAGLAHFKATADIDTDKVFLFGHSLGVLHGAVFADKGLVKGVMGYGGVFKPWHEYTSEIFSKQSVKYFGASKEQTRENMRSIDPFLDDWLGSDMPWEDVMATSHAKAAMRANLLPVSGDLAFTRHNSFFRSIAQIDFQTMWRNSQSHVLMMHGGYDIQTIESGWQNDIAAAVNGHRPGTATAMEFERTEHGLLRYPTIDALLSAMNNGTNSAANPGEKYNGEIATASLAWMQNLLANEAS